MKIKAGKRVDALMAAEAVVFLALLVLELVAVPMSDDYRYAINNGLLDLFRREYIQYMTWTGRSVAHILARLFLALPRGIFAVVNSICYVYVCRVLVYFGTKDNQRSALLFLLSAFLVFVFGPVFGQSVIWETGACNYLWTAALVFSFLSLYRQGKEKRPVIPMFLFGIIAGWTNENTGGAMILMAVILMVLRAVYKENVPGWMYSGPAGAVLGFALMILAPGNAVRAQDFVSTNGIAYDLMHDFFGFISVVKDEMTVLFVLCAAVLALAALCGRERRETITAACSALCGTAAVFAIILSPVPVVYDRSMFGAALFVTAAIISGVYGILDDPSLKRWAIAGCSVMAVFSALIWLKGLAGMVYTRRLYEQRERYIEQQKAAGNLNPVVPLLHNEFITDLDPLLAGDLSHYRLFWLNDAFAWHHGLESVQAVEPEKWHLIYENGNPQLMNLMDLDQYLRCAEAQDDLILLVNSTVLDQETYSGLLQILRVHGIIPEETSAVFSVIYDDGIAAMDTGGDASWLETVYRDNYFYLQGSADPVYSDIAVNGTEYSIDNQGITIVVYDIQQNRAVDSVTWNPESDQGGIRFRQK